MNPNVTAIFRQAVAHSAEMHADSNSEIHNDCDTCMELADRLTTAIGITPEELVVSPTVSAVSKDTAQGILAWRARRTAPNIAEEDVWH